MIKNTALVLYTQTTTYDGENNPVKVWKSVRTIAGNLQPKSLTTAELAQYGISLQAANTAVFFFDHDDDVAVGTRLGGYNVRAVNVWPSHSEAILVPLP